MLSTAGAVAVLDHTQQHAQYDHRYAQGVPTGAGAGAGAGAVAAAAAGQQGRGSVAS